MRPAREARTKVRESSVRRRGSQGLKKGVRHSGHWCKCDLGSGCPEKEKLLFRTSLTQGNSRRPFSPNAFNDITDPVFAHTQTQEHKLRVHRQRQRKDPRRIRKPADPRGKSKGNTKGAVHRRTTRTQTHTNTSLTHLVEGLELGVVAENLQHRAVRLPQELEPRRQHLAVRAVLFGGKRR